MLFGLAVASLFTGVITLDPGTAWHDPEALRLLAVSRFPRTAAVILTGASMAVAGMIMQMLARNRFIEPTTAGTGQSAALGILVATMLWPTAPLWAQMSLASLAAIAGSAGFLALIRHLPPSQPLLVPLVGLIYGGIIGAAVTFLGYQLDLLQYVEVWMNGEFSGVLRGRYELLWITGALTLVAYVVADQFTIVGLGREASVNLGLNYDSVVIAGLLIVSVVTALTVTTVGMIPFVGLVVPNVVSRLMGDNLRATLPCVALSGAVLVLACDLLGRILRYPYEIPVGTIFGILGGAVFLWLLYAGPARTAPPDGR
ncbi:ABC transporter permease [Mesobaculum littorinae]|uniref:ABC transporter permease n=1 Tax=Mesobaculum littorinae TaxID=2486419 RepID=A0A438AII7_9RHOB|nr:iron chelate uptake ABC transporter family permease subunit [Mesobaculum littorinae]RVV98571.1 ABC transporter permease [Mesobaculum littorinae]